MKSRKIIWKTKEYGIFPVVFMLSIFLFLNLEIQETKANVRPESFDRQELPANLFQVAGTLPRNFHPKSESPSSPVPANHPAKAKAPSPDDDKCFIQESFRLLADRGQTIAIIIYTGIFSGYIYEPHHLTCCLSSIKINSLTGESAKIRPPPLS